MKLAERNRAVKLRKEGSTYSEIKQSIGVSKSSLSAWLRDIPYATTEKSKLRRKIASINNGRLLHKRKLLRVASIRTEALSEIPNIKLSEIKLLGIMAYWAEGSKTQDGLVKFTNTNPEFIKFALKWLREVCLVPEEKFRLHLRIHKDTDKEISEEYWSKITKIPRSKFFKTTIKTSSSNGKRHNKVHNGIASIIVCNVELFHKINGWIEAIIQKSKL